MITFLIVVAVLAVLFTFILSVSATFTIVYDEKWSTRIKVLWIEKEIVLTKILSGILFPDKAAADYKEKKGQKKKTENTKKELDEALETTVETEMTEKLAGSSDISQEIVSAPAKTKKPNYFKNIWEKEGVIGIMQFVSNTLQSASGAVRTLIRGFHIYSLYVKIIVARDDAALTAQSFGKICSYYYPVKGAVLNAMRVDNCDDLIAPDFIAPCSEYGFQLIGSINVGSLLKVLLSAGRIFIVNLIKNK